MSTSGPREGGRGKEGRQPGTDVPRPGAQGMTRNPTRAGRRGTGRSAWGALGSAVSQDLVLGDQMSASQSLETQVEPDEGRRGTAVRAKLLLADRVNREDVAV